AVHHQIYAIDATRSQDKNLLWLDGVSINRSKGSIDFGHINLGLFCRFDIGNALIAETHLPDSEEKPANEGDQDSKAKQPADTKKAAETSNTETGKRKKEKKSKKSSIRTVS